MTTLYQDVVDAHQRIEPYIVRSPVELSLHLSQLTGANVYLKNEHLQYTGSFKLRGAFNKILSLSKEEASRGIIAASTGNHGLAVAYAAKQCGLKATIFVPDNASSLETTAIVALGAELKVVKGGALKAELTAREESWCLKCTFISPYNDLAVIAGQGTIGYELHHQIPALDAVFISVGGGGLISGISSYLKYLNPAIKIIGCSPANSCVLYESIKAGKILELEEKPSISDATMGGLEQDTITLKPCQKLVDDYVLVSEEEIFKAMRILLENERWMVEGAAGTVVAAFQKHAHDYVGQTVALLLCGRNISFEKFKGVICTT
jgi:threonine dehydratase